MVTLGVDYILYVLTLEKVGCTLIKDLRIRFNNKGRNDA